MDGNGGDTIQGWGGEDTINGSSGNDKIDGGDGYDQVIYQGVQDNYEILSIDSNIQFQCLTTS